MTSRSGVKRYRCYGKDNFGHLYDAGSITDDYGEWCKDEDVVALEAENVRLRAALDEIITKADVEAWSDADVILQMAEIARVALAALSPAAGEKP